MADIHSMVAFNNAYKNISTLENIGTLYNVNHELLPTTFYDNIHVKKHIDSKAEIIEMIYKTENPNVVYQGKIDTAWRLQLEDGSVITEINEETIKIIKRHAEQAGYGDLSKKKNQINRDVRSAKTISKFKINDELLNKIKQEWEDKFGYENVVVEPYKVNIYDKFDHFKEHRDTPKENLVGTVVFSLTNANYGNSSGLYLKVNGEQVRFDEEANNWIGFYPDIYHKVKYFTSENHRVNISFKIFSYESSKGLSNESIAEKINTLVSMGKFGLICNHDYSFQTDSSALKGIDLAIYNALIQNPKVQRVMILPVIFESHAQSTLIYDGEDEYESDNSESESDNEGEKRVGSISINVYQFSEREIDYLNDRSSDSERDLVNYGKRIFYNISPICYGTKLDSSDSIEGYLGNEYEEGAIDEINFTYLARAMIPILNDESDEKLKYSHSLWE